MKIVFLQYTSNTCYAEVAAEAPPGVEVQVDKKTWTSSFSMSRKELKIGESRYIGDTRFGIIGVYDADDVSQLDLMVRAALEAVRERRSDG